MPAKIPFKYSFLTLLSGLAFAAGAAFLLNFFLEGPSLGKHYDFLLNLKQPPPVSREILVINTDDYIENNDIFSVLMTMTEMESSALVMTGSLSPLSSPVTVTEAEVRRRFLDEYILIGANIRNLFEAIRTGSVSPLHAPDYVEKLVELTEHGRDRLLSALIDRDEDFLLSISVFGSYMEAGSKIKADKDGILRRVQPVDMENFNEHPVYEFLKNRYAFSQIETIDKNKILWLRKDDKEETDIPLDNNANIITPWNCVFREIDVSLFREYEEASRAMRSAFEKADELGAFSKTLPERSPLFLGDYALILREEMLNSPTSQNVQIWKDARKEYFSSLEDFLNGHAETLLVAGYEEVIEEETGLSDEGLAALAGMRDGLKQYFVYLREEYGALSAIRARMQEELAFSFCIMGPPENTKYSALLANTMITGAHIKPCKNPYIFIWSFAAAFAVLLVVFMFRPVALFLCGFFLSFLSAAVFSLIFIYNSFWIDPLISLGSCAAGVLALFTCKCAYYNNRTRQFNAAYGSSVPPVILKQLIKEGYPRPCDSVAAKAAVIAIKDINLLKREDLEKTHEAGKIKKMFFTSVKDAVFNAGGVITGFEGDTILACFGSSLDRTGDPVNKAYSFVKRLLSDERISWRFGIDAGNCAFYWSQETGFSVHGRPAVRARMLASRTIRLRVRALVTENVCEDLNLNANKTDSLYENSEPIYELTV